MFDRTMSIDEMVDFHYEYGDEKLAEAVEYIRDHEEEWANGEIRPEDIPNFEYDTALYVLNCIWFGTQWNPDND